MEIEIWIFENSYYIGEDVEIQKKAIKKEMVFILDDKKIKVVNGEITFIDKMDLG